MAVLRIVHCLEELPEDQLSSTYANIRDSPAPLLTQYSLAQFQSAIQGRLIYTSEHV